MIMEIRKGERQMNVADKEHREGRRLLMDSSQSHSQRAVFLQRELAKAKEVILKLKAEKENLLQERRNATVLNRELHTGKLPFRI